MCKTLYYFASLHPFHHPALRDVPGIPLGSNIFAKINPESARTSSPKSTMNLLGHLRQNQQ
jgi:hypothetical protein